jgi:amidohydrolase
MKRLIDAAKKIEPFLIEFRRDLHQHPELSFQESETARKVAEQLVELGLDVKTKVGGYGIVADLQGKHQGPTIALRADMDALPIKEDTGLPYASKLEGVMHACGHDAHTTILLGAARILVEHKDMISGKIRFIFQSAEEILEGAQLMIDAGVLDGVDEIYGLHNLPTCRAGVIATCCGSLMGSVDRFEIKLEGKGGHGAIPDQCIDPIVAASAIVMGLQTAVSREISPFEPAVVTIGSIQSGNANNIIPQYAELKGTIRTYSPAVQKEMEKRIRRIIEHIAKAHRCKMEMNYVEQVPVLTNSDEYVKHVERTVDQLFGSSSLIAADPTMAGEDFSLYLKHVSGCFFWLGSGPETGAAHSFGLHHPQFQINEKCLKTGAALLAGISINRVKSTTNIGGMEP